MNHIEKMWDEWKDVIPKDASEHQFQDMQAAFYAGVAHLLDFINQNNDFDHMEEKLSAIELMGKECAAFFDGFAKKRTVN